jgi:hypothetical protein
LIIVPTRIQHYFAKAVKFHKGMALVIPHCPQGNRMGMWSRPFFLENAQDCCLTACTL